MLTIAVLSSPIWHAPGSYKKSSIRSAQATTTPRRDTFKLGEAVVFLSNGLYYSVSNDRMLRCEDRLSSNWWFGVCILMRTVDCLSSSSSDSGASALNFGVSSLHSQR